MPAESTRDWTGETLTKSSDGIWSASITWTVVNASTAIEACNAAPLAGTTAIPKEDPPSQHPEWQSLLCQSVTPERIGPTTWKVKADYKTPEDNTEAGGIGSGEPLGLTWYDVVEGEYSREVDVDKADTPIVNSTGDPYTPRLQFTYREWVLTVERQEPQWNFGLAIQFKDTVNSDPITIPKIGTVPKWCLLCRGVFPTERWTTKHKQITNAYRFVLREPMPAKFEGKVSPFDELVLDQGTRALYQNTDGDVVPARINDGDGKPVATDVRLNGAGDPFEDGYTVGKTRAAPLGGGKDDNIIELPAAVFKIFRQYSFKSFTPLQSIFI